MGGWVDGWVECHGVCPFYWVWVWVWVGVVEGAGVVGLVFLHWVTAARSHMATGCGCGWVWQC
eukprot:7206616-Prorocentrum_lima.AAC.1